MDRHLLGDLLGVMGAGTLPQYWCPLPLPYDQNVLKMINEECIAQNVYLFKLEAVLTFIPFPSLATPVSPYWYL